MRALSRFDNWLKHRHERIRARSPEYGRRIDRNLGFIAEDLRDDEFYREVEAIRFRARFHFWLIVVLVSAGVVRAMFGYGRPFNAIIAAVLLGCGGFMIGHPRHLMRLAFRQFYMRRIVPYQYRLKAEYPELQVLIPKQKVFRRTADLRDLERRFISMVKRDVEKIEHSRRMRRWNSRNEKLREEMLDAVRSSDISPASKEGLEAKVLEVWDLLHRNPDHRKRYVEKVRHVIATVQMRQRSAPAVRTETYGTVVQTEEVAPDDPRIRLLEQEARERCKSERAMLLRAEGLQASDRRTKIRLLKQAIREERTAEEAPEPPPEPRIEVATSKKETRFIVLDEEMERRFRIAHLVPSGTDPNMAKEILLELLDPGSSQRRFQKAYRPETTLRRRVRQRYEAWCEGTYDPRAYDEALGWLVREGVLRGKPKPKDRYVYSLSANTEEAKSDNAREIISAVLKLDREMRTL